MKKSGFTEQQIAYALRQAESGVPIEEITRKMGITQATFYRWKKKFAGMGVAAEHLTFHIIADIVFIASPSFVTDTSGLAWNPRIIIPG